MMRLRQKQEVIVNKLFGMVKDIFAKTNNSQYIATVNQNHLNMLDVDLKKFVEENVILELTDDSDAGKLLGLTVELEYD